MEKMTRTALIIVDAQRGFMPASEGERLELDGFGELGVNGGEAIIPPINRLSAAFSRAKWPIATTQDFHPVQTAHFSDTPNYVNSWPVHCVGGTPGAELHPELLVARQPEIATQFIKGDSPCSSPEDDTSYTGALAYNPASGTNLPDWLREQDTDKVYVTGLALGDGDQHALCVDSTARDLHNQGFDVTLIIDATEAVTAENRQKCFTQLGKSGIRLATSHEILIELQGAHS